MTSAHHIRMFKETQMSNLSWKL